MNFDKIHNRGQAQIFRNHYIEYLTKTHPLVIWGMYLPVIFYLPYYASVELKFSAITVAFIFLAGIFFWTFFEYIIHRFVFHSISDSPLMQRVIYMLHGNHHEFPRDKQRLFMPPVPSLIISSLVFLIFYAVAGKNVFAFFPGCMLGYLLYGTIHYAIHAWNPPFKWMKPIWRNHHLHHYKCDDKGFGVSTPVWDIIFGTGFSLKKENENKEAEKKLKF